MNSPLIYSNEQVIHEGSMKIVHNIPKYKSEIEREEKLLTIYQKIYNKLIEEGTYSLKKGKNK